MLEDLAKSVIVFARKYNLRRKEKKNKKLEI